MIGKLGKSLKQVSIIVLALAVLAALVIVAGRAYLQRQVEKRIRITTESRIDSLETIRLGGVEQWIQIRGHDRAKPLLLSLHGGPGFPNMPFAHLHAELERDFVVVHWD